MSLQQTIYGDYIPTEHLITDRLKQMIRQKPAYKQKVFFHDLVWEYWQVFDHVTDTITVEKFRNITPVQSLDRRWRDAIRDLDGQKSLL